MRGPLWRSYATCPDGGGCRPWPPVVSDELGGYGRKQRWTSTDIPGTILHLGARIMPGRQVAVVLRDKAVKPRSVTLV